MTSPQPKRDRSGCGGDGCGAPPETWPLHNVRHRGVFLRLCTSCVLKYHPGSYCSTCFAFIDGSTSTSTATFVHCPGCPSLCHTSCLLPHQESRYLCPTCASPNGFSYFSRKEIGADAAKVLIVAARISAASMGKAVAVTRAEAERKVKEAVVAKRRAREMLDRAARIAKVERERRKGRESREGELEEDQRKKKLAVAASAEKRVQIRERDKLMKFQPFQGVISTAPMGNFSAKNGIFSVEKKSSVAEDKNAIGKGTMGDCTNANAAVKPQKMPPAN